MLKKANIQWSTATLVRQIEKGNVSFDNSVQRNQAWEQDRNELFIHSLIEGYPVPAFFFAKGEDGKYDALDGQQRSNAVKDFKNGLFALSENTPPITDEDGNEIEIAGMKFEDLPEFAQQNINDYSFTIYYFEGITQDEISELFFRLNNGKPLTAIELTRVRAKSIEAFQEIASHPAMQFAVTEKGKKRYNDELISMQMWAILNVDNVSFVTKDFRPIIESAEVTTGQMSSINVCLDMINDLYNGFDSEDKEDKKILRKIKAKTHIVSLVYMANKCIENNIDVSKFIELAKEFFSGKSGTTISEIYNTAAGSGSAKAESIRNRINEIDKFLLNEKVE